jgi:hypothetical protein
LRGRKPTPGTSQLMGDDFAYIHIYLLLSVAVYAGVIVRVTQSKKKEIFYKD